MPFSGKDSPQDKDLSNQWNVPSAEVEKPQYIPPGVKGWFSSPSLISFLLSIKHRQTLDISKSEGITQAWETDTPQIFMKDEDDLSFIWP